MNPDETSNRSALPLISRATLALHNGSDRPQVWVGFRGLVYDVTLSRLWRSGLHYGLHWAGQDLTAELADAPHSDQVFLRFPVIGRLE